MTNFGQFVPMMDKALKEAWAVTGSTRNNSPFIDFDPAACKFDVNADVAWIEKGAKIYSNSILYDLLISFPGNFVGYFGDKQL